MNKETQTLLDRHFEVAFDSEEGIKKLRQLILTLAMQGKLVEQDPNDQPASELLEEIKAEKERLVAEGKIKRGKALPEITEEEKPYEIPDSWEWVRLGEIGNTFNGNSINANEKVNKFTGGKGRPYIGTKDVGYGRDVIKYNNGVSIPESEKKFRVTKANSILICSEGGSAGRKCGITNQEICFGNKLFTNEPFGGILSKLILYYYMSSTFITQFKSVMTGIIGGVSIAKFNALYFPLPPLPEQKRIVEKVDQLMQQCDQMEKLRTEREEKRFTIHKVTIKQLLDSASSPTFSTSPNPARDFLFEHFNTLHTTLENVDELRKAILQLAVMGKLVPQDPNDQPASELLKEIKAEKEKLIQEGKIKKQKPLPEIKPEEIPYELPKGWEWVRLGEASKSIDYGTSKKTSDDHYLIPVYRMGNIVNGELIDENLKYISPDIDDLPRLYLEKNDILFNRTNSYELVGKTALYNKEIGQDTFASYLIRVRLIKKGMLPLYVCLTMNAPYFRKTQIEPQIVQQCGQANFNGTKLSNCLIPLPPQNEYKRIIENLSKFMMHCDKLEERLRNKVNKQNYTLESMLNSYC